MSSGATVPMAILAALSWYRDADRLYALTVAGASADLIVERWQGKESLSGGFEWWIDALSTDAGLDLDALLGQSATLSTRAADGGRTPRSGLVRQAECVGSDGGLARYRLGLVPWSWLPSAEERWARAKPTPIGIHVSRVKSVVRTSGRSRRWMQFLACRKVID